VTIVKNHGTEIFCDIIASDLLGDKEFAPYSHTFMLPWIEPRLGTACHDVASFDVASFIVNNTPGSYRTVVRDSPEFYGCILGRMNRP
jgi:hypothetical protein